MLQLPENPVVAIVGATGAVGREMLAILEQRAFPISKLRLFASPRSVGTRIPFRGESIACEALEHGMPSGVDLVLFSAGKGISKEWAPKFRDAGALVVDNSSAFRADPACPLVVPEVNPHALAAIDLPAIIANPNCSTIIALVAVTPLHRAIDMGQIEGGFIQGMGWLTTEELVWDAQGRLRTHAPSTYKIPTIGDTPAHFHISLWHEPNREDNVGGSKAVGEPPFMLALSVLEALRDAVAQARSRSDSRTQPVQLNAPATPQRVLEALQ